MPARSSASRRQGAYRYLRPPVFPGRWCVAEALLSYGEGQVCHREPAQPAANLLRTIDLTGLGSSRSARETPAL